jgi:hypothetical protein
VSHAAPPLGIAFAGRSSSVSISAPKSVEAPRLARASLMRRRLLAVASGSQISCTLASASASAASVPRGHRRVRLLLPAVCAWPRRRRKVAAVDLRARATPSRRGRDGDRAAEPRATAGVRAPPTRSGPASRRRGVWWLPPPWAGSQSGSGRGVARHREAEGALHVVKGAHHFSTAGSCLVARRQPAAYPRRHRTSAGMQPCLRRAAIHRRSGSC